MKVLVAGASGAFGRPLVAALLDAGHDVIAMGRDPNVIIPGTRPLVVDALDRDAMVRSAAGVTADVVVHQLTALRKAPAKFQDMELTNRLRTEGTRNLLEMARAMGAHRFVTQSMVPGYGFIDHGNHVLTEQDPFGQARRSKTDPTVTAMRSTEEQVFGADGIDGIALRYGAFYGLTGSDNVVAALRAGKLPTHPNSGTMSWIHLTDAASATVAAIEKGTGGQAYNIVDDTPVTWAEMFAAHATAAGTKPPRRLPAWMIRMAAPYFAILMLDTSLRVSNAKAKAELGWTPTMPGYREGIATLQAA